MFAISVGSEGSEAELCEAQVKQRQEQAYQIEGYHRAHEYLHFYKDLDVIEPSLTGSPRKVNLLKLKKSCKYLLNKIIFGNDRMI